MVVLVALSPTISCTERMVVWLGCWRKAGADPPELEKIIRRDRFHIQRKYFQGTNTSPFHFVSLFPDVEAYLVFRVAGRTLGVFML